MRALFIFMRTVTRVNSWIGTGVAYLIGPIFLLMLAEVFLRYLMGSPAVWTNELSQLLFGAYAVLAGGYIAITSGHVSVDILHSKLPARRRALVDTLTSVLFFLFLGALLYFGASFALESMETWERSQSAWNPPIWPFKLMIPVSALLLLLQGVVKLMRDILALLGIELPPDLAMPETEESDA